MSSMVNRIEAHRSRIRDEINALAVMSYHGSVAGEASPPWFADITMEDIEKSLILLLVQVEDIEGLMLEVVKAADGFDDVGLVNSLRALDAYCAEHLPEKETS